MLGSWDHRWRPPSIELQEAEYRSLLQSIPFPIIIVDILEESTASMKRSMSSYKKSSRERAGIVWAVGRTIILAREVNPVVMPC